MEKHDYLAKLQAEIDNGDVSIESKLSVALEDGLTANDFFVAFNGLFRREYSKDVLHSEMTEDSRKKAILQFHLARNGIYDQLPEGLLYEPLKEKASTRDTTGMSGEYKRNKRREQAIRRFFMPFENDFFWQRVQLEKEESALLEGLQSGILNKYFSGLWEIDPSIPQSSIIQLILLLPYAHRIAGDLKLTTQCLQKILQEEVNLKKISALATNADEDQIYELGKQELGRNMLCGSQFYEPYPVLEFSIGPLQRSKVHDYLEGGSKEALLKTFYRFFIPVEADVVTSIEVADEKRNMHIKNDGEPILGYSTFL